jgi:hypothetical protein
MGTQQLGLRDVSHGAPQSRARILAPLRYLLIFHPEKSRYDFVIPGIIAVAAWGAYSLVSPKPPIFGDAGLLRFVRDLLIMAVPFMVGALAAVAMGAPGPHLDRRPIGTELHLDGNPLTLRSFTCYLLGYLSFLGLLTLGLSVFASLMHDSVIAWTATAPIWRDAIRSIGALGLSVLLSFLSVTVFWALYFLTDVVNRP